MTGMLRSSVHSYTDLYSVVRCVTSDGGTISSADLSPVIVLEVTFRFKSGRTLKKMIDLKKIGTNNTQLRCYKRLPIAAFHSRMLHFCDFLVNLCCFPAVKPRSPHVWNVTFHLEPYQALIYVGTPYRNDYLTTKKQLFQLHIWTAAYSMVARTD